MPITIPLKTSEKASSTGVMHCMSGITYGASELTAMPDSIVILRYTAAQHSAAA